MDFIKTVNETTLEPKLLIEANRVHSELPEEDRSDMAAYTIAFIKLVREEWGYQGREAQDVLLAINFRMEALSHLMVEGHREVKGWVLDSSEEGMVFANEELFLVAAKEPLIPVNEQARFDPNSFFQRLLKITEQEGQA